MSRVSVTRAEVGGFNCVFLDTDYTIQQPVEVTGHLAALTISNVGLQVVTCRFSHLKLDKCKKLSFFE